MVKKNTPVREKTTPGKGRKKSTAVPPSGQITQYFKKKAADEEEEKRTTFVRKEEGKIKESIRMFSELEEGEDCVIGRMCSRHNAKLKKIVTNWG